MNLFYKVLSIVTSILFIYLFSMLFFMSNSFVKDLGLEPTTASLVLSRRAAMFMLGVAVMMFASRNLQSSEARRIVCCSMTVVLFGLSCMGIYEFLNGNVNDSIIVAIIIETVLWLSFGIVVLNDLKERRNI